MLGKRPEMESLESKSSDSENFAPPTAVILCLRGEDPSLDACLKSLIAQDFPNFEIHFVLDSRQDPALNTIQNFLQENRDCQIKTKTVFLTENPETNNIIETCSLKNQALIAAISAAEETIEVIALVDADGVVQKDWLSSLIEPLADQKVGAATGSRWFDPRERNPGSIVRQTWNAAALPQMNFYNIPWGGALAIKRSTIEDCELLRHWSTGFCEDTMLPKILAKKDYKLTQVRSVIVRSTESTTLWSAANWISRQLLTVRLHHSSWPLVLGHAIFSGACLLGIVIAIFWCVWNQEYMQTSRLAITLLIFLAGNVALLQVIQIANRDGASLPEGSVERSNEISDHPFAISRGPGFSGAMLTQLLYPLIAIKAALMQKVQWRGITYRILPGKKISMDDYRPYQANPSNSDASL